jgi:hypothetical protein
MANFIIWATSGKSAFDEHRFQNPNNHLPQPTHTYQSYSWHQERNFDLANPKHAKPYRSVGHYQLANWLRGHGYTVKVIDFCLYMTTDQLAEITERHIDQNTLAIGASTTFWREFSDDQIPAIIDQSKTRIAKKFPNIKWCLGGHLSHRYIQHPGWRVLQGEGENIVLRWLDELSDKTIFRKPFDIKETSNSFTNEDYIQPYEFIPIELGRGCMFKCKFCQFHNIGKKPGTYLKNYECLYREILDHHEKWGTTRFYYTDDTVNESEEKIQALADIAQKLPFKLEWIGFLRADLIWSKPQTSQMLKDSGLRSAYFGIESFERSSSKLIGKGWSGLHAKDWLLEQKLRWKNDINWTISLIVGVPGQTIDQLSADVDWVIKNNMYDCLIFPLNIDLQKPGEITSVSEFEKNYQQYGFVFPDPVNRSWYWENGDWNYDTALKVAGTLLEEVTKNNKIFASWNLGEAASLNYDIDELMNRQVVELVRDQDHFNRGWNFIENYVIKNLL